MDDEPYGICIWTIALTLIKSPLYQLQGKMLWTKKLKIGLSKANTHVTWHFLTSHRHYDTNIHRIENICITNHSTIKAGTWQSNAQFSVQQTDHNSQISFYAKCWALVLWRWHFYCSYSNFSKSWLRMESFALMHHIVWMMRFNLGKVQYFLEFNYKIRIHFFHVNFVLQSFHQ